jgi:hypothetical protein
MWLSLVATYTGFAIFSISNALLLFRVAKNPNFTSADTDLKVMIIDVVDTTH